MSNERRAQSVWLWHRRPDHEDLKGSGSGSLHHKATPSSPGIKQAGADRAVEDSDLVKCLPTLLRRALSLDDDVADLPIRLEVLSRNVEVSPGEHLVEVPEHARHVAMNMNVA